MLVKGVGWNACRLNTEYHFGHLLRVFNCELKVGPPSCYSHRENLLAVLVALELHLGEIAKTGEKLANYHETIIQLDRQNEILRDALSTPDHPLITMQDK